MRIAILAALFREVRPFLRTHRARPLAAAAIPVWEFEVAGRRGILALSGLGEQLAVRAASLLGKQFHPEIMVCCGFGGGLGQDLPPGAVVLGESFWRYQPEEGLLNPLPLPPAPVTLPDLEACLRRAGLAVFGGAVVTTAGIINKARQASLLTSLAHPVVDLETGGVAAYAAAHQIPFVAVRVVTDTAGEEIPGFLVQAVASGSEPGPREALGWIVKDPRRLAGLLRLWRRAHLGADRLRQALEVLVKVLG